MFKEFSKGFFKLFTTQRVIILVVFIVLAYFLMTYSSAKGSVMDGYDTGMSQSSFAQSMPQMPTSTPTMTQPIIAPTVSSSPSSTGGYMSRDTGAPSDLLPTDANSKFSDFNILNKSNMVMPDMLDAGYLIGLDTVGQSLRNANLQERSDPVIAKSTVGPWNNSTIEPDLGRVPLELGYGVR